MRDEEVARFTHRHFDEGFSFLLDYDEVQEWSLWLAKQERTARGEDLAPERVRAEFLAADVDGVLVGRVSIRYELNDFLAARGGHVGYGVLAEHRGRGYATAILRAALARLRAAGVHDVLVTVDDTNVASIRTIERRGGRMESVVTDDQGHRIRRYWCTD